MKTRVGPLELRVPRVRDGSFSPELFRRYQRSERALVLAMMEMVVNGVSTRKVRRVTETLCGTSFSKSTVSELCKELDSIVGDWSSRPLPQRYPFIIVDALQLKIRIGHRVLAQSAFIATGIAADGQREVLALMVGDSLVVSDDHRGLVNAVQRHFQGAMWQRCQTHLERNILDKTPKTVREGLAAKLRL